MKLKNALFSLVLSFMLAGPAILSFSQNMLHASYPDWLTARDAAYLAGSESSSEVLEHLSLADFTSKELQASIEAEVANCIPAKAGAMLANASIQRAFIATSDFIFDWNSYPTYYGSTIMYSSENNALFRFPRTQSTSLTNVMAKGSEAFNSFAQRHDELRVFVHTPMYDIENAPTGSLFSKPYTYSNLSADFLEKLNGVSVIDGLTPFDAYRDSFFATDHHWTMLGAYDSYLSICDALGTTAGAIGEPLVWNKPEARGSFSRQALYSPSLYDNIVDFEFDLPDYVVEIDGKSYDSSALVKREEYERGSYDPHLYASRYGEYYHSDLPEIIIRNPISTNKDALLIVGDSYSNCLERLLAQHYATTYVLDVRYANVTLDAYLEEHPDISQVLFLNSADNICSNDVLDALSPSSS